MDTANPPYVEGYLRGLQTMFVLLADAVLVDAEKEAFATALAERGIRDVEAAVFRLHPSALKGAADVLSKTVNDLRDDTPGESDGRGSGETVSSLPSGRRI